MIKGIETLTQLWPTTCHGRWMSEKYEPQLISVIMPTYNRAHLIGKAMDSVFAQTYRPIELIVVDDGSTDDTIQVIEGWRRDRVNDDEFNLRYFHQENRGPSASRNLGLIESKGEFIQFLDSDDLLHPEKLQAQTTILRNNLDCDFVWAATANFEEIPDYGAIPFTTVPCGHLLTSIVTILPWHTSSGIYRRKICLATGPWHESLRIFEDWEYCLRFASLSPAIQHIAGTYSLVRNHSGNRLTDYLLEWPGLRNQLEALNIGRSTLELRGLMSGEIDNQFAKRYFFLFIQAIYAGADDLAAESLHRAQKFWKQPAWSVRIAIAQGLYTLLGAKRMVELLVMRRTLLRFWRRLV